MDFRFEEDVESFRERVRAELAAAMARLLPDGSADPLDLTGLDEDAERRMLGWAGERGYLALSLPTEHGGGGLSPEWQAAFNLEAAAADAPLVDTAVTLVAEPIARFGSAAQKEWFLPRMARGELRFCIAYSEQEAGSDLGALGTRARPRGPGFVLSGTKAHVTGALKADWCLTVARTDPDAPLPDALSMLLVPMGAAGVVVRRRRTMTGWTLPEVTFDDVSLGPEALLGALGGGWRQLLAAVGTESGGMFHVGFARHLLDHLASALADPRPDGSVPADDQSARETLGLLATELAAAERFARRAVWAAGSDEALVASSAAKVYTTELLQRLAAAAMELRGADGALVRPLFGAGSSHETGDGRVGYEILERVHATIGGGTSEVRRNLLARAWLGLGPAGA